MDSSKIFCLTWLAVKFVVDFIGLIFIFWRLVHHTQSQGEVIRHKGDVYFLGWLGIKFVVDIIFIILLVLTWVL